MLSNAYFLAKFRFDTAENEPAKNLQNLQNLNFPKRSVIFPFALQLDSVAASRRLLQLLLKAWLAGAAVLAVAGTSVIVAPK